MNIFEKSFAPGERNYGIRESSTEVKMGYLTRESHHSADPGFKVLRPPPSGFRR